MRLHELLLFAIAYPLGRYFDHHGVAYPDGLREGDLHSCKEIPHGSLGGNAYHESRESR